MAEASCLQLDSSSTNEHNQNQASRHMRSSQSDRPDNREITAVSSPPMTKSEEPNENFCEQVSSVFLPLKSVSHLELLHLSECQVLFAYLAFKLMNITFHSEFGNDLI